MESHVLRQPPTWSVVWQYLQRWSMVITAVAIWYGVAYLSLWLSWRAYEIRGLSPAWFDAIQILSLISYMVLCTLLIATMVACVVVGFMPTLSNAGVRRLLLRINPWWVVKEGWNIWSSSPDD